MIDNKSHNEYRHGYFSHHCFATVSKKSCSTIELIKSLSAVMLVEEGNLERVLRALRFCPLVCCFVTLSQMAAKNGAKSSSENMLVIVS